VINGGPVNCPRIPSKGVDLRPKERAPTTTSSSRIGELKKERNTGPKELSTASERVKSLGGVGSSRVEKKGRAF